MNSDGHIHKLIANVTPSWHCITTHLDAPDQQTAQTFAYIEKVTLADHQLLTCIRSDATGFYLPS